MYDFFYKKITKKIEKKIVILALQSNFLNVLPERFRHFSWPGQHN